MRFSAVFSIAICFLFLSSCSIMQESKLQSILDKQIGKARIIEKNRLELDNLLGKNNSKLKDSLMNYISDRTVVQYTEIIIDGKKARVRVLAEIPKMEELSAFMLMAGFLPREQMMSMTVDEVLAAVSKKTRRPAGEVVRCEVYEFTVDFEKNKNWIANPDQLSNAFGKKNQISKR